MSTLAETTQVAAQAVTQSAIEAGARVATQASTTVADKTSAVMAHGAFADRLGDKVLGWVDAFEAVAKQYAPDVVNGAIEVVRFSVINTLVKHWVLMLVAVFLLVYGLRKLRATWTEVADNNGDNVGDIVHFLSRAAATIIGGIMFTNALPQVTNVWLYVGAVQPKFYVARMAMEKIVTLPDAIPPAAAPKK